MSLSHGAKIPRTGLSLLLDPANIKSYPGTGSTWFDLSGNDNHATLTGSPVFSGGKITFDGVDDHATITANQDSLDFSNEQTVIIWMYHTFTTLRRNPWNQAYGGYGTWTHESGANINSYFGDSGGDNVPYIAVNSGSTPTSVWTMLTFTRDTTNHQWYKNDVPGGEGSHSYGGLTTTTANISIGNGYAGRWSGDIGLVMAYQKRLNSSKVAEVFEATRGRFGI